MLVIYSIAVLILIAYLVACGTTQIDIINSLINVERLNATEKEMFSIFKDYVIRNLIFQCVLLFCLFFILIAMSNLMLKDKNEKKLN